MLKKIILLSSAMITMSSYVNALSIPSEFTALNFTSTAVNFQCNQKDQVKMLGGGYTKYIGCATSTDGFPVFTNTKQNSLIFLGCLFGEGIVVKTLSYNVTTGCNNLDMVGVVFTTPVELSQGLNKLNIASSDALFTSVKEQIANINNNK